MVTQYRPTTPQDDNLFYSPKRDLAYLLPKLVKVVCNRFNASLAEVEDERAQHGWRELVQYCEQQGITYDQLIDAMEAYQRFFVLAIDEERFPSAIESFEQSGWNAQPLLAKVAVLAMLGSTVTGAGFRCIRDTHFTNGRSEVQELNAHVRQALESAISPVHWLDRLTWKLKRFLKVFRR